MSAPFLGVMFRREWAPELLMSVARRVEAAGLDELWVVEDLGYHGGFSQVVAALAATERITVGLGIAPAVVRNAAFTAMEVATTARLFPGRFHMGIGHGVERWIDQVGATPVSWLASIAEVTTAVKQLVSGESVSVEGRHVRLHDVQLVHPSNAPPLVSLGVRQPKSVAVAGQVADGVVLAECSGPLYVSQVRASVGPASRITVFVNASADVAGSRAEVDRRIAQGRFSGQLAVYEGTDVDLYAELNISGPADTWRSQAQRWNDAGADAVIFVPLTTEGPEALGDCIAAVR